MEKSEFLSRDEIAELTGWKQAKKQVEHLRSTGLPFFKNARGQPIVTRAAVNGTYGKKEKQKKVVGTWQPTVFN